MKLLPRKFRDKRTPRRERAVVVTLAVILGIALYLWLALSVGQTRQRLHTTVTTLQAQAAQVEQQAAEIARLRTIPAPSTSQTDLRTLVQDQAGTAGLSRAVVSIDALNSDQLVMVFGAVAFADWLKWIADMKAQRVRVDICRIEALSSPGMVSVTVTLIRAPSP